MSLEGTLPEMCAFHKFTEGLKNEEMELNSARSMVTKFFMVANDWQNDGRLPAILISFTIFNPITRSANSKIEKKCT